MNLRLEIKMKIKRFLFILCLLLVILVISNYLVRATKISTYSIFESNSVFTYFGVLIGFAISIYTFSLSMVENIKIGIDNLTNVKNKNKIQLFNKLVSAFNEMKEDIWLIFYSLLAVVIMLVLKNIENPLGWNVEKYLIPETINLGLFIFSMIIMYDLMKSLFNISEINILIIKNKQCKIKFHSLKRKPFPKKN